MTPSLSRGLNSLALLAISLVLVVAFADQILNGDLPCPLCILQRAGFVGVAAGLAFNVKFGPRPSHYGMVILSAIIGGAISARQTLLHIVPGTGAYGDAILGLHFYTWALVLFVLCVAGSAVMLLFDRQFEAPAPFAPPVGAGLLGGLAICLALLLALGNGISTVLECAGGLCPDDPTGYQLLDDGSLDGLLKPIREMMGR